MLKRIFEIVVGAFLFLVAVLCTAGSVSIIFIWETPMDNPKIGMWFGLLMGVLSLVLLYFSIRIMRGRFGENVDKLSPVTLIFAGLFLLGIPVGGTVVHIVQHSFEFRFLPIGLLYFSAGISALLAAKRKLFN